MMVCLIFHTAIITNKKNWRITIKLHLENLSIFLKKRTYPHARTPLPLFVFVRFSVTRSPRPSIPLLNERTFWMTPKDMLNNHGPKYEDVKNRSKDSWFSNFYSKHLLVVWIMFISYKRLAWIQCSIISFLKPFNKGRS